MNFGTLHSLQVISLVGILTSAIVHLVYTFIEKDLPHMWALYPCWLLIFFIGYLLGKRGGNGH